MSGEGLLHSGLAPAEELPPLVGFGEAEAIGVQLHDRMVAQLGAAPMTRDDLGWGDLVQFVLRKASEAARDRASKTEDD